MNTERYCHCISNDSMCFVIRCMKIAKKNRNFHCSNFLWLFHHLDDFPKKKTIENTDKNMNYDRQYGVRLHDREIEYFHWNWVLFRIFQRQFKIANLSFDIVFFLFLFTTLNSVLFKWQTRNETKRKKQTPDRFQVNWTASGKKILCKNIWTKRK